MKPEKKTFRVKGDDIISGLIKLSGYSSILFVALILIFLLREGLPALANVPLSSLFSTRWYPTEGYFGILPLISGTLLVTIFATLVALPFVGLRPRALPPQGFTSAAIGAHTIG